MDKILNLICKLKAQEITKIVVFEVFPDLFHPEEKPEIPPNQYFVNEVLTPIQFEEAEALKSHIVELSRSSMVSSLKQYKPEDFGDCASMSGELNMKYILDLNDWTLEVFGGWDYGPEDGETLELAELKQQYLDCTKCAILDF